VGRLVQIVFCKLCGTARRMSDQATVTVNIDTVIDSSVTDDTVKRLTRCVSK
jgi:hypothetical protein